jgi:hypothetical protein
MTRPSKAGASSFSALCRFTRRPAAPFMLRAAFSATLMFALCACARSRAASSGVAVSRTATAAELAVRRYVEAFNRHDVAAMIAQAAPDVQWHSLIGDSLVTEAAGRVALERGLTSYFRSYPSVRSTLGVLSSNGPYVSGRELVQWEQNGVRKSQASLSVYEIREGRVLRVWYYPAVAEGDR